MSRIEEIDKIVDEIGDADSLYEFAECVYEDRQRIAELEEQLKNVIVPKFKIGQNMFFIDNEYQITQGVVNIILTGQDAFEKWCKYSIDLGQEYEDDIRCVDIYEEEIFTTKEEALAKLEELKGETKC